MDTIKEGIFEKVSLLCVDVSVFTADLTCITEPAGRAKALTPPCVKPVILPLPLIVTGIRLFPHQYLYNCPRRS